MTTVITSRRRSRAPVWRSSGGLFYGRDYGTFRPLLGPVYDSVGRKTYSATIGANTSIAHTEYGLAVRGSSVAAATSTGLIGPDGSFDVTGFTGYSCVAICRLSLNNTSGGDSGIFRADDDADLARTQVGFSFAATGTTMEWHSLVSTSGTTGWSGSVFVSDTAPPTGRLLVMATRWANGGPIQNMWSVIGSPARAWVDSGYNVTGSIDLRGGGSASQLNPHIGGMGNPSGSAFPGDVFAVVVLPYRITDGEIARVINDPFTTVFGPESRRTNFLGPTVSAGTTVSVPAGAVSVSGYAPTVTATANQTISVPAGSVALTGYAPTVSASASQTIAVPVGAVSLTGYAPSVFTTAVTTIAVPAGAVSLAGFAPTISYTTHAYIDVPKGAVGLTGYAPTVLGGESGIWTPVTVDAATWTPQ